MQKNVSRRKLFSLQNFLFSIEKYCGSIFINLPQIFVLTHLCFPHCTFHSPNSKFASDRFHLYALESNLFILFFCELLHFCILLKKIFLDKIILLRLNFLCNAVFLLLFGTGSVPDVSFLAAMPEQKHALQCCSHVVV
jgi:hypothetical protein